MLPTLTKNKNSVPIAPRAIAPCTPETNRVRPGSIAGTEGLAVNSGGVFNSMMSTPHDRNSQIISDSFHAVVIATAEKTTHRANRDRLSHAVNVRDFKPIVL
jgi:hypothetical protein